MRKRALILVHEGRARDILPLPRGDIPALKRSRFYGRNATPDDLWRINDDVFNQFIRPLGG